MLLWCRNRQVSPFGVFWVFAWQVTATDDVVVTANHSTIAAWHYCLGSISNATLFVDKSPLSLSLSRALCRRAQHGAYQPEMSVRDQRGEFSRLKTLLVEATAFEECESRGTVFAPTGNVPSPKILDVCPSLTLRAWYGSLRFAHVMTTSAFGLGRLLRRLWPRRDHLRN